MKNIQLLISLLCLFFATQLVAQEKHTISGYVTDKSTGEGLIAATVADLKTGKGTVTNSYGFYSLTVDADSLALAVSYVGYQTKILKLNMNKDLSLDIKLNDAQELQAVEIVASKTEDLIEEKTEMSTISVPITQLRKIPALLGEADVLKAIQLLPGVQSGGEGQSGFYVRGGSQDQNLILLDGSPVYNASHLFGFFSVFNVDAIKDVKLIKGGFPARYGGRLSSVLDISMKEGNNQKFRGAGTIGLIASKFTLEGPIVKDKAAFIVSARRTYIDILARPIIKHSFKDSGGSGKFGYYFYDLNAKVNWKISKRDRIFLSMYSGDDKFYAGIKESAGNGTRKNHLDLGFGWGNLTSTFRWNHLWTDKLFSNTSLTYSKYNFNNSNAFGEEKLLNGVVDEKSEIRFGYDSGINDLTAKIDFDYIPEPNHFIRFGAGVTRHDFRPGDRNIYFNIVDDGKELFKLDSVFGQPALHAYESVAYIEDDITFSPQFKANIGLHYSNFFVAKKAFHSIQPRVSARYLFPNRLSMKASFATMQQNIQYLSNENLGLPWDQWLPTTDKVRPQTSWQVAAGLAKSFDGGFEVSVEGYYKEMNNVTSYKEGASILENKNWQDQITQGEGKSYGLEVFLQKKVGKLSGWIGYTLSRSLRRFDDKSFGEWYPFKFDRRHDLSIVAIYDISEKLSLSGTWVYGTGNTFTFPNSKSYILNKQGGTYYPVLVNNIAKRNNYRLAPYHRADINLDIKWGKKRVEHKLSLGAYNAYNRKNPFFINPETVTYSDSTSNEIKTKNILKQYSLFRLIPSIAYSFKF